jgi:hypothetical protein
MRRAHRIGHVLGIIGIVFVLFFLIVNYLSSEGPAFWRQLLDRDQVQILSVLILFIGGEVAIALGSILTAQAKGRLGAGVIVAVFGLFGVLWILFLRPGLYPSILLTLFAPIGFVIALFLKKSGGGSQS